MLDAKGQPVMVAENIITARNVVSELEGVPFFYTPYLKTDASDPMGPLETHQLRREQRLRRDRRASA